MIPPHIKLTYSDRNKKVIASGYAGWGWKVRKLPRQGQNETYWDDGNVLYLVLGGGYTDVYSCQISSN